MKAGSSRMQAHSPTILGTYPSTKLPNRANVFFHSIWRDMLMIPAYAAAVSIVALFLHLLLTLKPAKSLATRTFSANETVEEEISPVEEKSHVEQLGGSVIFGFLVARLLSSLTLLGLSVATLVRHHGASTTQFDSYRWEQIAICGAYVSFILVPMNDLINYILDLYLTALIRSSSSQATLECSYLGTCRLRVRCNMGHLCIPRLLASSYLHSDASGFERGSVDLGETIHSYCCGRNYPVMDASTICSGRPSGRSHIPAIHVDARHPSQEPMPEPNPEQTAPIISMMLFAFLDRIVFLAYRVPHLSFEQLPPLPDYGFAKHLVKKSHPAS